MANYLDLSGKSTETGGGRLPKLRGQINTMAEYDAAKTLVDTDSGNVYILDDNAAITLPALKAGLEFTFIPKADGGTIAATAATVILGGSGSTAGTGTTITVAGPSNAGDTLNVYCDGTNFYASANGASGAFTVA